MGTLRRFREAGASKFWDYVSGNQRENLNNQRFFVPGPTPSMVSPVPQR